MASSEQMKQNLERLSATISAQEAKARAKQPAQPKRDPESIATAMYPNLPSVHDKDRKG